LFKMYENRKLGKVRQYQGLTADNVY